MEDSSVITNRPVKLGNHAVIAVAAPKSASISKANTCSRRANRIRITTTANSPGISRTVCSQPISLPVKEATSMTKLFNSADQVAKLSGMAAAIR